MGNNQTKLLHNACIAGNLEKVKLAVSKGADIHKENDHAVRLASEYGHLDVVKYLVSECSADIHADNDYALRLASRNGYLKIVKYLVSQGADIHAEINHAVQLASKYGNLDVVRYLVSQGADIHANNSYTMQVAAYIGHLDVVRYLVSHGADIHAGDDRAVQMASADGHLDAVAYLVSQGAPITTLPEFQRRYASIYMKQYVRRETRAASRIYFWWIRRCYGMSRSSGIRMCLASLAEYETLCAL